MVHGPQEQPSIAQKAPDLDVGVVPNVTSDGEVMKPPSSEEVVNLEFDQESMKARDNDQTLNSEDALADSTELTNVEPRKTLKDYVIAKMHPIVQTYDMDGPSQVLQIDVEDINVSSELYLMPDPKTVWWTHVPPAHRAVSSTSSILEPVWQVEQHPTSPKKFQEYIHEIIITAKQKRTRKTQRSIVKI